MDLTQVATPQDATLDFGDLKPGTYTLCEVDMPIDWFSSLEDDPYNGDRTEDAEAGTATVCIEIELEPGEAESIAVDNTRPETLVLKEGNLLVHDGDTITYTFDVSNKGNTPLENVSVADPKCDADPVRDSANDSNSDADALLEPAGTPDATKSEVWRFTCTKVLGAHADDEENPVVNVATAHAFDLQGNEVTDTDDHKTTIIHPDIELNKELRRAGDGEWSDDEAGDDPIQVHVGDTIEYRLDGDQRGRHAAHDHRDERSDVRRRARARRRRHQRQRQARPGRVVGLPLLTTWSRRRTPIRSSTPPR